MSVLVVIISNFVFQELRGETWVFSEAAIVTVNGVLIGGPTDFLKWAEQEQNYENFRPMALYETLAEEAYKEHLNSQKVRKKTTNRR